jgi:hypothetical protein
MDATIIIMPEMANVVICSESGKSPSHQELITILRYENQVDAVNIKFNSQALQNQHYQIYSQIKHATRAQCNIWSICGGHQRTQGRKRTYQITGGCDQIEYPGDKSTHTAGLTTTQILFNSVID